MNDVIDDEIRKLYEKLLYLVAEEKKERKTMEVAAKVFMTKDFPDENTRHHAWKDVVARKEAIREQIDTLHGHIDMLYQYEEDQERIEKAIERIRVNTGSGWSLYAEKPDVNCVLYQESGRQYVEAEADHRLAGIEHERLERATEYHLDRQAEMQQLFGDERKLNDLEYRDLQKLQKQDQRRQYPLIAKPKDETPEREESIDSSKAERKRSQSAKQKHRHSRRHDHRLEIDF